MNAEGTAAVKSTRILLPTFVERRVVNDNSCSYVVVSYPTEIQILLKRSKISLCRSTICMYTIIDTNTSLELKIT